MTTNPEVFIRRNKLRRLFETEFRKINSDIKKACAVAGVPWFHIKYSQHLLDRAIQREIDETYVFELFNRLSTKVVEMNEYLAMPERPETEEALEEGINYRPLRLELTDGTLWLGLTVSKPNPDNHHQNPSLQCRMAFVNSNRHPGKISTKVINMG